MPEGLETLHHELTRRILDFERMPPGHPEIPARARELLELELRAVALTDPDTAEGAACRVGAVTSALDAGDHERAVELARRFSHEVPERTARYLLEAVRVSPGAGASGPGPTSG